MKEFTKGDIATAIYDAFAYRLGPDVWEEAEQEFWEYLNASQQPDSLHRAHPGTKKRYPNNYLLDKI